MKVRIKDLRPNPFRDFEHYKPVRLIVDNLKDSMQETYLWPGLTGRKNGDIFEIAFGHHRLIAIQELYQDGEKKINFQAEKISDVQMIIMMARENETGRNMTVNHIELMVSQAKKFLEANPEIARELLEDGSTHKEKIDSSIELPIGYIRISRLLGWPESRVKESLSRLKLIDEGILVKEVVESLPTERAARDFTARVKSRKPSIKDQKRVGKRIIESRESEEGKGIYGESAIDAEFVEEKHAFKEQKKKDEIVEFSNFISSVSMNLKMVNKDLEKLIEYKEIFDSEIYQKSLETWGFNIQVKKLAKNLTILKGEEIEKRTGALQESL